MIFVFDKSAFQYLLESFPKKLMQEIWLIFCSLCESGEIVSDRETKSILMNELHDRDSLNWIDNNSKVFKPISEHESKKLGQLIIDNTFDFSDYNHEIERSLPVATPFLISMVYKTKNILVVCKRCKEFKKILEICKKNGISIIEVEEFLIKLSREYKL